MEKAYVGRRPKAYAEGLQEGEVPREGRTEGGMERGREGIAEEREQANLYQMVGGQRPPLPQGEAICGNKMPPLPQREREREREREYLIK